MALWHIIRFGFSTTPVQQCCQSQLTAHRVIRDGDSEKGLIEVMYEEIKATMVKEEARPIPVTVTPWERKKLWLENQ